MGIFRTDVDIAGLDAPDRPRTAAAANTRPNATATDLTCEPHALHVDGMPTSMIQIRNVPANLHQALRQRAAQAGMTLSDYLKVELEQIVERPPLQELRYRLATLPPAAVKESPAAAIRRERDRR